MRTEFRKVVVPDEINALLDFDRRTFADFPGDLFDAETWTHFRSHWMIVDGEIVGCSAFVHDVDYNETPRVGSLWIVSTGIAPENRRKGYGEGMKKWQIEYARQHGFRVVVTNMRVSNAPIIRLNEKLGFQERERSPKYYTNPTEDAIVMELKL
jgi:ribosomal protein S18 acetylase RimI-like enzyme